MNDILKTIRNWSEAWALLIPLLVILFSRKKTGAMMRPLLFYVVIAFPIGLAITILYVYHHQMPPDFLKNPILYNIHSFIRVIFFGLFMYGLQKDLFAKLIKTILIIYCIFVVLNFSILEHSIFKWDERLFTAEGIVQLFFCLVFFIRAIQDDSNMNWATHPSALVCAGFGFYNSANFFHFLCYQWLLAENKGFGKTLWTIHHITFVIFCIILALAFIKSYKFNNDNIKAVE